MPSTPPSPANDVDAIQLERADLWLGSGASAVHVLDDMSLAVPRGVSAGVVGPSGSGKTTLLMVLAGLERVDGGRVEVLGTDITTLTEDETAAFRGRSVGIVFQSFHLIPNMTALENVAVPLELAGEAEAFECAEAELRAVGLGHRLTHYPGQLSGGEQQRVAIARALAPRPATADRGRADGQSRRRHRHADRGPAVRADGEARHDARAGHARSRPSRRGASDRSTCARAASRNPCWRRRNERRDL